ncbi:hypothetical protein [Candidatus Tisiphia endosymbiont of Oplodontha viridula]|uniref:hypothetical protein n=1 Tax=Candidatus Tisiphia endosymbiont of Oplodontha viridula TaxID=3077925 RepID=UPI0035C9235E
MSKDKNIEANKELLQKTACRLGISEDELLSGIPETTLSWPNPKVLGGYLKNMQPGMTSAKVLEKQLAKDPFGNFALNFIPGIID